MQWADVINDSSLRNLPYKIELNEYGQIVMSPASNKHALLQSRIDRMLGNQLKHGEPLTECAIDTAKGVKVADVVWCSDDFIRNHGYTTPYPKAPELCVEIVSPSNSTPEMEEKRALYFERGAREVWIISQTGKVMMYDSNGVIERSIFGPLEFPALVVPGD